MKTIKFDCKSNNAPAYSCNKPGDNSGDYVPAEVARGLYRTLFAATSELQIMRDEVGYRAMTLDVLNEAEKALAAADREDV